MRGVIPGLHFMHSLGYGHYDLKPGNIIRVTRDNEETYVLIDFGRTLPDQLTVGHSNTGGTAGYNKHMFRLQGGAGGRGKGWLKKEDIKKSDDAYALCVTLCEVLCPEYARDTFGNGGYLTTLIKRIKSKNEFTPELSDFIDTLLNFKHSDTFEFFTHPWLDMNSNQTEESEDDEKSTNDFFHNQYFSDDFTESETSAWEWNAEEVHEWAKQNLDKKAVKSLKKKEVDGRQLLSMNRAELKRLGVKKDKDAVLLKIKELREPWKTSLRNRYVPTEYFTAQISARVLNETQDFGKKNAKIEFINKTVEKIMSGYRTKWKNEKNIGSFWEESKKWLQGEIDNATAHVPEVDRRRLRRRLVKEHALSKKRNQI